MAKLYFYLFNQTLHIQEILFIKMQGYGVYRIEETETDVRTGLSALSSRLMLVVWRRFFRSHEISEL